MSFDVIARIYSSDVNIVLSSLIFALKEYFFLGKSSLGTLLNKIKGLLGWSSVVYGPTLLMCDFASLWY